MTSRLEDAPADNNGGGEVRPFPESARSSTYCRSCCAYHEPRASCCCSLMPAHAPDGHLAALEAEEQQREIDEAPARETHRLAIARESRQFETRKAAQRAREQEPITSAIDRGLRVVVEKIAAHAPAPAVAPAPATAPTPSGPITFKTIAEVLAEMPAPGERLKTGLKILDRCSRGGFARRRVYMFVGPPGRGKSAFVNQCARKFAEQGAEVLVFAHDEGDWQAAIMDAEGFGFDRDKLEGNYSEIRAAVEERTAPLKIRFAPPEATLDDVEAWLRGEPSEALDRIAGLFGGTSKRDPATTRVVVIDSVQRVRASRSVIPENRRAQADSVMAAARKLAALDAIILSTSKANRSSWSSKNPADRIDALASGLDSSEIEYQSDALFSMGGSPEERSFLQVCKNRPGSGLPTIALKYDEARATFSEIDPAAAEEAKEEADREHEAAKWSADEARVLKMVREHPGKSRRLLREVLKINSSRLGALLEELSRKGRLVDRDGWYLALPGEAKEEA